MEIKILTLMKYEVVTLDLEMSISKVSYRLHMDLEKSEISNKKVKERDCLQLFEEVHPGPPMVCHSPPATIYIYICQLPPSTTSELHGITFFNRIKVNKTFYTLQGKCVIK